MEQFEAIRRDHAREGLSIRELARCHGVHRRAVRQALDSAVPPPKRSPEVRPAPALGVYHAIIDAWIKADKDAPRNSVTRRGGSISAWLRSTARRPGRRSPSVSERQVCRYVRKLRRQLGEVGEVCVPLFSDAGVEAEVDWGEAKVRLRGELVDAHLFLMRPCYSAREEQWNEKCR